ncbi:hypothetical protein ACH4Y0_07255 [Streptomyces sp. NPDC020707]|uniref:hypothetical protein n=1 Tax=Streptomyces sp. NPDC020707 TaxID=3365084 RepID=UPI0037A33D6F
MSSLNDRILDDLFDKVPVPEGYKGEIVEGAFSIAPHLDLHWQTTLTILDTLAARFDNDFQVLSDVRIDFPGDLNGFAPAVAKLRDGSTADAEGRWLHQDVEFVAEVIDPHRTKNDYGPRGPRTPSPRFPSTSSSTRTRASATSAPSLRTGSTSRNSPSSSGRTST